jgi:peptidyl-prolyl cis-trans isomerase A (cyclophilin A)
MRSVLVIAVFALFLGKPTAQETMGEIYGKVMDERREGVPGVLVTAQGSGAGLFAQAETKGDGTFSIHVLPSTYRLRFSLNMFTPVYMTVVVSAGARTFANAPTMQLALIYDEIPGGIRYPSDGVLIDITTSLGRIAIVVNESQAPITAKNFLRYVDYGLYNGGRFYRVTRPDNYTPLLPDRPMMEIIQGGMDPAEPFKGFPAIPLERTSVTGIKHVAGTVSMARGAPDSATSEFFILLDDQASLDFGGRRFADGQGGAAFGSVAFGLDVARKIQQQPSQGQNLTTPVKIISIARVK